MLEKLIFEVNLVICTFATIVLLISLCIWVIYNVLHHREEQTFNQKIEINWKRDGF